MRRLSLLIFSCALLLAPAIASAAVLVVPNANTNSPGNDAGNFPVTPVPLTTQILVAADQFPGPIEITGFAFRPAPGTGPVSISLSGANVFLSTSSKFPNSTSGPLMSTTFADNIGPDNTLVFSGSISENLPGCSGPGVCPFGPITNFTTPFFYNPAKGNLLEELVATSFSGSGFLDAASVGPPGGPVARVTASGTNVTMGTLGFGNSIIEFAFTPAPEPDTRIMLAAGVAVLAIVRGRRAASTRR
jgi:hypothetical protein